MQSSPWSRPKDLDGTKSLIGQLSPYAVLLLNGREVHTSKKLKRTNKPIWPDATTELLIMDRQKAKLGVVLKDDRDLATDPIVGTYQIGLDDMLELMVKGQEWYNLAGVKTGRVKMMLDWKPVALRGGLTTSSGYLTPVGVMRLHFQSARDLRNVETMGKSDPYVRVLLSGVERGRTVTFKEQSQSGMGRGHLRPDALNARETASRSHGRGASRPRSPSWRHRAQPRPTTCNRTKMASMSHMRTRRRGPKVCTWGGARLARAR